MRREDGNTMTLVGGGKMDHNDTSRREDGNTMTLVGGKMGSQ